jgi:hypothetical protein
MVPLLLTFSLSDDHVRAMRLVARVGLRRLLYLLGMRDVISAGGFHWTRRCPLVLRDIISVGDSHWT